MASITKRGAFQFQAQIRRKGYPLQQKTFETRREAKAWASVIESEMHRGVFVDRSEAERTTLGEALTRYLTEVTSKKRGADIEQGRIRALQRHPLALRSLASLRSVDFAAYRDARLEVVAPATVRRELVILSGLFTVARKEWSLPITNPLDTVSKPEEPKFRERRLVGDEEARLFAAAQDSHVRAPILTFCIRLAIETGMRAGEIVKLTWQQIDLANHVIRLKLTKNGDGRTVPLSVAAEDAIRALPRPLHGGRITNFFDTRGMSAAFRRACKRAGIHDLHFHDLRHEAASRLAPTMPIATLAKIMGWRTLEMAMRYYNPLDNELVAAVRKAA